MMTARRVLVTGAGGQVGRELMRAVWPESMEVIGFDSTRLNITLAGAVTETVERFQPDVIVNAAAYTAVDRAEDEPTIAMAVNATAVDYLAKAANMVDALLVHISTDYVFDGTANNWYAETDKVNPIGVYAQTKLLGEQYATHAARALILRTSWVYGALGSNFVTTMLRLAGEREEIGVVADQFGCPTAATDIASGIVKLVVATDAGRRPASEQLYHLASPVAASWYEVASATFRASSRDFDVICKPLSTDEYPTKAARPANSRLDSTRLADEFDLILPSYEHSLPSVVAEIEAGIEPS